MTEAHYYLATIRMVGTHHRHMMIMGITVFEFLEINKHFIPLIIHVQRFMAVIWCQFTQMVKIRQFIMQFRLHKVGQVNITGLVYKKMLLVLTNGQMVVPQNI